ncbi:NAD-specific glutamate dehydrogenase [compost metagenome]
MVLLNLFVAELATDKTLYAVNSILCIRHTLTLRYLTNKTFATFINSHNRWCRAVTFRVCNYLWLTCNHIRYGAISCTEVDADDFTHRVFSYSFQLPYIISEYILAL